MTRPNTTHLDEARRARLCGVGAEIRRVREAERLTQTDLGNLISTDLREVIPQATISRWEIGAVTMDVEQLRSIELALYLPLGVLARRSGYSSPLMDDDRDALATSYMGTSEMAIESLRAAQVLGLGVRVHNQWRPSETTGDGAEEQEWVVQLYSDATHLER
jgi:transcriptional regulator with XRE-family HTH domain